MVCEASRDCYLSARKARFILMALIIIMSFLQIKHTTHYPVLHREVSQLVSDYILHVEDQKRSVQMFDGTFGGGGHSVSLLNKHRNLKVLGTDLDYHVLEQCRNEYEPLVKQRRLALEHSNFVNIPAIDLKKAFQRKITTKERFDVGLLDLGFSSYQLEDIDRGFSYMPDNSEGPLDMRFDASLDSQMASASDILNNSSLFELTQIFKTFGEERFASVLAKKIVEARQGTILGSAGDFRDAIKTAFPQSGTHERSKAIRRAFQAIRIAVNYEILNLTTFLDTCPDTFLDTKLNRKNSEQQSSLLLIITFHSLEERLVS